MEEVLNKIKKLLALSASPNEHEAKQALFQAQKLMEKHSISQAMMANFNKEEIEEIREWENPLWVGKNNRSQWRNALASVLAEHYACKIYCMGPNIHIIGRNSDVQTVRYLFEYCEKQIEGFAKAYAGNGKAWCTNYRIGICKAIHHKLDEAKKEARQETISQYGSAAEKAIVKVDEKSLATEKFYTAFSARIGMKTKTYGQQQYHPDAEYKGFKDGQKINLGANSNSLNGGNRKLPG